MTDNKKEELLEKLRLYLFDKNEKDMYKIFHNMREDIKINSLLDLDVITEDEYFEVIESSFSNLHGFISEHYEEYKND